MYLELGPARRLGRESLVSCRCKGDDEEGRLGRHPTMGPWRREYWQRPIANWSKSGLVVPNPPPRLTALPPTE